MKLVILAAGKGKRMGTSSEHTPKPILKYKDKTLIHHKLEQMPDCIDEIIIVVGHLGEKIIQEIGHSYSPHRTDGKDIPIIYPITYIEQKELLGTADSLWRAKEHLQDGAFLILMGDDLYSKGDLEKMCNVYLQNPSDWVALIKPEEVHIPYGKCILDADGYLIDFRNDLQKEIDENFMYTGACILTPEVFNLDMIKVNSTEYGLPQTFIQENRHLSAKNLAEGDAGEKGGQGVGEKEVEVRRNIHVVFAEYWKRITSPEDLVD